MPGDPAKDWQRLTRLYSEMSDGEVLNLAAGFGDLTEMAQQVLRDEMKKRGMGEPQTASQTASPPAAPDRRPVFGRWSAARNAAQPEDEASDDGETDTDPADLPHEFTWKTLLCECSNADEAWQVAEILKHAGIESWIEGPSSPSSLDLTPPRVIVAADQLDQARMIAAQPIPQEIIDQSKARVEDFEPPSCPRCGASDPLLESVDPSNTWACETCGARWAESAGAQDSTAPGPSR